jgi:hypothetical protein
MMTDDDHGDENIWAAMIKKPIVPCKVPPCNLLKKMNTMKNLRVGSIQVNTSHEYYHSAKLFWASEF